MGGNCTTPTLTTLPSYTETVRGTELPAFVAAGGRELYDQARNLAFQPYPEYTGPRTATYDEIDPLTGEARTEMGFNLVDTRDGFDPTTGNYYFNDQIMPSKEAFDYSQIQDRPLEGFTDDTAKGLYRSERDAGGKYLDDAVYDAAGNVVYRPDSNIPRTDEELDKLFSDYNIPQLMSSVSAADLAGGIREMETGEMVPVQSRLTQQEQEAQRLLGDDSYQKYLTGDGTAGSKSAQTFLEGLGGEFKLGEGTEAQKYMDIYSDAMDPAIRDIQERTRRAK